MKKRIMSLLLAEGLLMSALVIPAGAAGISGGSLSNFGASQTYRNGQFEDIQPGDWCADDVAFVCELGLFCGKSSDTFDPEGNLTVAEAVKLAAVLNSIYYTGKAEFDSGNPWYQPYVTYALAKGILSAGYADYNAYATRSDFAVILSEALPAEALTAINQVEDGAIPDVSAQFSYGPAVYELYRAGVLAGEDGDGTFYPNKAIKRSEAAAVVSRMADAESRKALSMSSPLTAEDIFRKCSSSVFYIEIYDAKDKKVKTGSGFFLSDSGLAVTNYHVINGGSSAKITTSDGKMYDVKGVCGYNENDDIALLQIDGSGFPYLEAADSDVVATGAQAFAIGSPLGLQNTISQGIISCSNRTISGKDYIQTTASISPGSSGGALLDKSGRVIGVTCATATSGQNINLAVPIDRVSGLDRAKCVPLSSLLSAVAYYAGYYPTPDFGTFAGVPIYYSKTENGVSTYMYKTNNMSADPDTTFAKYEKLLEQNFFEYYGYMKDAGNTTTIYVNSPYGIEVSFGITELNGYECVCVTVSQPK